MLESVRLSWDFGQNIRIDTITVKAIIKFEINRMFLNSIILCFKRPGVKYTPIINQTVVQNFVICLI